MVKFVRKMGRYNPGDTAVFSVEFEQRVIAEKFAVDEQKQEPKKQEGDDDMAKKNSQTPQDQTKNPNQPQTRQTTVGPQTRK